MTKIDIISGFLGAGKTTLIKKLIEEDPELLEKEEIQIFVDQLGESSVILGLRVCIGKKYGKRGSCGIALIDSADYAWLVCLDSRSGAFGSAFPA